MSFTYTIEPEFLTKEECDIILNFSLENLMLIPPKVFYGDVEEINKVRKSNKMYYPYYIKFPFLLEKMSKLLNKYINVKGFNLDYKHSEFEFTEYNEGGYFDWHKDTYGEEITNYDRYCSLVIQLNDDYEEGHLQIKDNQNKTLTVEKRTGNLILFSSSIQHRMLPVKSGVRYTIVNWIRLIEKKDYKKTLL
jgi:PKHD-type hydroxylase